MALDLPLPKTILVHNWVTMKDGKMSKSKGNVIYPEQLIDKYGLDATKYFLLKQVPVATDGVFSPEEFIDRYNYDLCNDLSNLLNRTISMVNKYFEGNVPSYNGTLNEADISLENDAKETITKFEEYMKNYEIANAIQTIWTFVSRTNKYIDETSPWSLAKEVEGEEQKDKEERIEKLKSVIYHLVASLKQIAIMINPFMNSTSKNMLKQLGIEDEIDWNCLNDYKNIEGVKVIEKGEPIFMRLDREEEIEYIKNLMKN